MMQRGYFLKDNYNIMKFDIRTCIADINLFPYNLQNIPSRPLSEDFIIYYRTILAWGNEGYDSIMIDNRILCNDLRITEDDLYEIACKNTLDSIVVSTLPNVINTLSDGLVVDYNTSDLNAYVVTNSEMFYGAGVIAVPEVRRKIGDLIQSDYFILPSSKHEVIIVPDFRDVFSIDNLTKMVVEVNETVLKPDDILSCKVQYCKMDGTVLENADSWTKSRYN